MAETFDTPLMIPPGIGTGAAYADLDAIGKPFKIEVPKNGVLYTARYFDRDDEGLQVDLHLFRNMIAMPTDNSALALTDEEADDCLATISFVTFSDFANNQFSLRSNLGIAYKQTNGILWGQVQARGALNIAAANRPRFQLSFLSFD